MKMFPTKHMTMMEFMTEMNRLFSKPAETDHNQPQTLYNPQMSSPNHYGALNRLSSSTDSTSPDTFPDITTFQTTPPEFQLLSNASSPQSLTSDTPIGTRRPIIGRKIFSTPEQVSTDMPQRPPIPQWDHSQFSPTHTDKRMPYTHHIEQRSYYELFPTEKKPEFITPVKVRPTPGHSLSPSEEARALAIYRGSPRPSDAASTSSQAAMWKMCTFCRKNGETPMVYMTHKVKERVKNDYVVTCPILRSHVCPTCGGTGDNAHTITYCPVLRHRNHGLPLQSTTITLKNTRVKSNGRKRF